MQLITIINSILLSSLISLLVFGIMLNIKYIEKNVYRKSLLVMLSFWLFTMCFVLIKFYAENLGQLSYNTQTLSMQVLMLGIPSFFMLVSYPVVVLNSSFLKFKSWWTIFTPPIILFTFYFIWHAVKGLNPFEVYPSVQYVIDNITSVSVLLRLMLVVVFMLYAVRYIVAIYMVVPCYDKYVRDNIADSDCNVAWIRPLLWRVAFTSVMYFTMLFFSSPYVNFFYLLSVVHLFAYLIETSIFRRSSSRVERLVVRRVKGKWFKYVIEDDRGLVVESAQPSEYDFAKLAKELDEWMCEQSPYSNIDFTTSDILGQFPNVTNYDLREFFNSIGESFQSYVRRYRIMKACQMIMASDKRIYSKQIFGSVGFSYHSSFSRSFVAMVGMSPTEFARLSSDEQKRIESSLAFDYSKVVNIKK